MIRVAAVGDVHYGTDSGGTLRTHLEDISDHADVLLLAGDLTRHGAANEAAVLASDLADVDVPVVTVLGNHDFHRDEDARIRGLLEAADVQVLEGETAVVDAHGERLGIAGIKGFGGGFAGACGSDFGEPEMKAFIRHTKQTAASLSTALGSLNADHRVVLLHYSPVEATLRGERLEIYPFLGSFLLAEAIDGLGADLVLHGHAHNGSEKGVTPGGIHVRNVAQPVIRHPYNLYCLGVDGGRVSPA